MTRTDTAILPTIDQIKAQAKRLRDALAQQGTSLSHSQSLELVSHQHGHRDWNSLRAAADQPRPNSPRPPLQVGDMVRGRYLGQAFTGKIISLRQMIDETYSRIIVRFDTPVDVVKFDSFSALRQRVEATIDRSGRSPQVTSDGVPQMQIDLPVH